ncbi:MULTISPECIES: phage portal protein [unclassified Mesorhizobium]|uniref:phage portal protein n=1 Tax=unclassified Mesorhizobium TaxID=325217 RepID=UPI0011276D0F|nr:MULTISPECIES: phage portal protein [unclassified Mesorhizobium]TPJ86947.1 phage portal protein [Mesorhizobium sp. B2-5-12]TPK19170.1 phage portal protein [Mesorhizobium sp. B2-5-6]
MGLFDRWLGRPIDLNADSAPFWRGFFGLGTTSGETVTFDTAMQLDAVWACVRLIGNSVRTLPCLVYKDDGVTVDKDNPLYEIMHDMPNLDNTASEFWGMVALCLCLDGNFFAEKKMSGSRLVSLEPFHPLCVDVKRDERNNRYYEVTERMSANGKNGGKRRINEDRMFHVRGELLPGCDRGLSPIGMERNIIGNALAGEKAGAKIYKSGLIATTFLMTDQKLDAPQRKQISETLSSFMGAEKAGGVAVLEAGFEPKAISINPKDAQMLETRQYSVEQICRIFGIPPVMIGHAANGTTTWGSGIEQLILQFTKTCLTPLLRSIESAVYRDLLDVRTRKTTVVKFSMEGLLRGDSTARAAFLSKMVDSGIYTPDEARAYENKAAMDGGDKLIVNGTMTRLDKLGEEPVVPPAANQNAPTTRAA